MFEKLVGNLTDLIDRKINPTGSMWRNEQLRDGLAAVEEARDFSELVEALRPLAFDNGIRIRLADLERCGAERRWLSARSNDFLRDWYAECAEDARGTRTIAQMVGEVSAAISAFQPDGKKPDMRRWHAKQRQLWEIEQGK